MLLGQDLGRRHQRALRPVPRREEEGERRDDGLPAPDVPLEEARHRPPRAEVVGDLLHRPPLRARSGRTEALRRAARRSASSATSLRPGRSWRRRRFSSMRAARTKSSSSTSDAARSLRFPVRPAESGRPRARAGALPAGAAAPAKSEASASSAPANERPPAPRRHVGGAVVDRNDPARVEGVVLLPLLEELGLRVLDAHLPARSRDRRPVDRGRPAAIRAPGGTSDTGCARRLGRAPDPSSASASTFRVPRRIRTALTAVNRTRRVAGWPHARSATRRVAAPVFVSKRQREEQVADRRETLLEKLRGQGRSDAGNPGHGIARRERGRGAGRRRRRTVSDQCSPAPAAPGLERQDDQSERELVTARNRNRRPRRDAGAVDERPVQDADLLHHVELVAERIDPRVPAGRRPLRVERREVDVGSGPRDRIAPADQRVPLGVEEELLLALGSHEPERVRLRCGPFRRRASLPPRRAARARPRASR